METVHLFGYGDATIFYDDEGEVEYARQATITEIALGKIDHWATHRPQLMKRKAGRFVVYLLSLAWWEKGSHVASYKTIAFALAHAQTAYISAFCVPSSGDLPGGGIYSPAATFHGLHKRYGGHGVGAY